MRNGAVAAIAAVLLWATPALAAHCPKDVKLIDEALAKDTMMDEAKKAEVMALRDEGDALHKDGKHAESIEALHKALEMLGIAHP